MKVPEVPTWENSIQEFRTQEHLKAKGKPAQKADGEADIGPCDMACH